MSAFLGPIHYWLYNKIQLQQAIVDKLYLLGDQHGLSLKEDCDNSFGPFENKPLEEMIDHGNIHGWLQERVSQVEYKYAYSVTALLGIGRDLPEQMKALHYNYGKELAQSILEGEQAGTSLKATDLYKTIGDYLLDGMPCDHANQLMKQSDTEVIWTRKLCVHSKYWDEIGGEIRIYYELRDAWLEGLVKGLGFILEKLDVDSYRINKMNSIQLMKEEHQYILRMLEVVRKACYKILQGQAINYVDFDFMIDFIRNYADAHHHGKEEKLLFHEMVTHLGALGNKLITQGMLVEHDFGRLYIQELKEALTKVKEGDEISKLDVIANAISYTHLLKRHIDKEDSVVYTFAERQLEAEIINKVNLDTEEFENAAREKGTQVYYQNLVDTLEQKYH